MRFGLGLALALAALGGCASDPRFGETGEPMAVTQATELPAPTGTDLVATNGSYLIGPGDKLTVRTYGVEELGGEVTVDAAGRIQVPLAGSLQAGGKSPEQLADDVAAALRRNYVRDPRVTVTLREAPSQTFTVDGQVREPGIYPVVGNLSLMRAVASAKGLSEFAKLDDVVVFRTVQGRQMAALYNLEAIRRGLYADPRVYPNDVVVVGDSKSRRLFRDLLQIAPPLATPLVLLFQR